MSRLYRPETDTQRVQAMQAAKAKYNASIHSRWTC
jgi:hypothetical protein